MDSKCSFDRCVLITLAYLEVLPIHYMYSVNPDYQPNMEPFGVRLALLQVDSCHCIGTVKTRHLTAAAGLELFRASASSSTLCNNSGFE